MDREKPADTPLPLCHQLYENRTEISNADKEYMKTVPYRKLLGSLIFLSTRTRPDISTAVSILGNFQENPSPVHWKHLKQVIRYLVGTVKHGLTFPISDESMHYVRGPTRIGRVTAQTADHDLGTF